MQSCKKEEKVSEENKLRTPEYDRNSNEFI